MPKYYGKGTVKKLGPNKFFLRLSCGKDPVTGKYRQVTETFMGTKREAEHRIEEMRQALESGITPNADKMTYAQLSDDFHTAREEAGERRPATLRKDRNIEKHIIGIIGKYRIGDITPAIITQLYSDLRTQGVGEATVANCHRQVRQILGYAVKARYINFNPATALPATPQQPVPDRPRFDYEQIERLYSCIASLPVDVYSTGMLLAFHTGMRLGEICGLKWGDVDFKHRVLHVERQRTQAGEIAPLKTKSSKRELFIDSVIAERLEAWKKQQASELEELTKVKDNQISLDLVRKLREEYKQGPNTPVFTNKAGHWLDTSKLSKAFARMCTKNDFEGLTFHSLRHLHFSIQKTALNTDVKTIQQRGGWASSKIPMDVYVNGITEADKQASDGFGAFVGRIAAND